MTTLDEFFQELGTNAELLEAYKKDPKKVMQQQGIPEDQIDLVLNADIQGIKKVLGDTEYRAYVVIKNYSV